MARRSSSRAFTLLEAVVALALLSAVIVATLALRAQSVAAAARIERALAWEQAVEATLARAVAGTLFPPLNVSDAAASEVGAQLWRGEVAGVACSCERRLVEVDDPLTPRKGPGATQQTEASSDSGSAATTQAPLVVWRYLARCGRSRGVVYTASAS